ncbi:MAG: hypothetical protein HY301_05310 [Verrucomicrobia bacterium]|nr:hypothetical protein [Verrucomicrobiota bacterium]
MKTKRTQRCWLALAATLTLAPGLLPAADEPEFREFTNRFSISARAAFNLRARFTTAAGVAFPANTRTTPDGAAYNYDDGYVLPDVSGNALGITGNWGYDSAAQIVGNTIGMSRSTSTGSLPSPWFNDDPQLGAELLYSRQLGRLNHDKWKWGVEGAANWLNVSLKDRSSFGGPANRTTDFYGFEPGTTPDIAPYFGRFSGSGFLLDSAPSSTTTGVVGNAVTVSGSRKYEADLFGFRVGPYLEIPLTTNKHVTLTLSGGLAVGILDGRASWNETVTLAPLGSATSAGHGSHTAVLWGGYAGANVAWQFKERWSLIGGAQFQTLGTYRHNFGGRGVEVDLGESIFVTLGLGYSF